MPTSWFPSEPLSSLPAPRVPRALGAPPIVEASSTIPESSRAPTASRHAAGREHVGSVMDAANAVNGAVSVAHAVARVFTRPRSLMRKFRYQPVQGYSPMNR